MNSNTLRIKKIALIGMLSATLTGGKLALIGIANVEIVTLLIITYTVVFGLDIAFPATLIFVSTEMLIFGVYYWVLSYYIHWCGLALTCYLVKRYLKNSPLLHIINAVVMTALFGVNTSLVDALLSIGLTEQSFFEVFSIYYVRGINFYITHITSSAVTVTFLFIPLKETLLKIKNKTFI